jgi:hypothetical protein
MSVAIFFSKHNGPSGIQRILTMVYNTLNYWGSGLYPSSGILKTRTHNVTGTGSVSEDFRFSLRWL